jgi:hypothetical protein
MPKYEGAMCFSIAPIIYHCDFLYVFCQPKKFWLFEIAPA